MNIYITKKYDKNQENIPTRKKINRKKIAVEIILYGSPISHRVPIEFPNPTKNSWRVFERLNGKISTLNWRKMLPRQDQVNSKKNEPTLTSVASPHLTDLESPFERKTFRVDRAMSEPVEPRLELFLLLEFRDIFSSYLVNAIPCHFVNNNSTSTATTERDSCPNLAGRHLLVGTL